MVKLSGGDPEEFLPAVVENVATQQHGASLHWWLVSSWLTVATADEVGVRGSNTSLTAMAKV